MKSEKKIIQFNQFDIDKLKDNVSVLIIGKSHVGKTSLIKDIVNKTKDKFLDLNNGSVVAPLDRDVGDYDEFPQSSIHYNYNSDIPANVIKNQFNLMYSENANKNGYFIMDCCDSKRNLWVNDPNIETILFESNEYNLTYILATTYPLIVKKEHRTEFNYVFLFGDDNIEYKRKLYENYAKFFNSFELFNHVFTQITKDYGCMVIQNLVDSDDIIKRVKWYKAVIKPKLKNPVLYDTCKYCLENSTNIFNLKSDVSKCKTQLEIKDKYIERLEDNLKFNSESLKNIREEFEAIESNYLQLWKGFQYHRKCNVLLLQALSVIPLACTTLTYLSVVGYL